MVVYHAMKIVNLMPLLLIIDTNEMLWTDLIHVYPEYTKE